MLSKNLYSIKMKKWISNNALLIIFSLCIISRLPQLLSPNLFLDGDESIVGLMAKHFSEGKGIPYFFYGQSYGFSLIEVLVIRIFYSILGVSDIAIKISMLLLWTLGIIFFYKTLKQLGPINNAWASFLVTVLFIFAPAWAIWSMKARGGYITSFTLTSLITYLLFNKKLNKSMSVLFLIGFLMVVIYQSQPLWLAGLIPIVIYHLFQLKQFRSILFLCAGMAISILLFNFLKADLSSFWSPKIPSLSNLSFESLTTIPNQIYQNLSGSYNYKKFIQPNIITNVLALITILFIFIALALTIFYFIKGRKVSSLFYVFSISVICTISYPSLINDRSPRYLLPLYGYVSLVFFALIMNSKHKKLIETIFFVTILLGVISMYTFKDHKYEQANKHELLTLIDELESRNIHHVYSKDGLLQWQIIFYSNEQIIARYFSNTDRYPKYIELVDNALNSTETKVAMVGFINPKDTSISMIPIDDRYFIYENPDETVLLDHGFIFK